MMQTVQLSISDSTLEASVREALIRTCAWHVDSVARPNPSQRSVLVLDGVGFARLPLPLFNPERVVLITRKDPQLLAEAWDAGIVSVVNDTDPISTVLLAIMAAGLRVSKSTPAAAVVSPVTHVASGISPNLPSFSAPLAPQNPTSGSKRRKIQ
jgi:hypothetical protein